jgi:hypothetical protein
MKNTEKAFLWITEILEKMKIPYKISGGFAARIYGVNRELADIDIEVNDNDIALISNEVKPYIVYGPDGYKDENWDLNLMTLQYEGQEIDIAGIEAKIFNKEKEIWEKTGSDLDDYELIEIYGKKVPIEKLDALIAHKTKLSREVDIEDIKQLKLLKK